MWRSSRSSMPALGDVDDVREDLERFPSPSRSMRTWRETQTASPLARSSASVADVAVDLAAEQLLAQPVALLELLGVGDRGEVDREQLLAGVARDLAKRVVDLDEAPVGRGDRHADGRVLEGDAEPLTGCVYVALDRSQLGDVLDGADEDAGALRVGATQSTQNATGAVSRVDAVLELEHRDRRRSPGGSARRRGRGPRVRYGRRTPCCWGAARRVRDRRCASSAQTRFASSVAASQIHEPTAAISCASANASRARSRITSASLRSVMSIANEPTASTSPCSSSTG